MRKLAMLLVTVLWLLGSPFAEDSLLQKVEEKYGPFAKNRFVLMNRTLDALKDQDELKKLEGVNDFFNNVRYAPDLKVYNQSDYWATPWEFLGHDMGDCEDYVIAKYFALKHLGIDPKKLYFTYVKSRRFPQPHMVLTYFETPKSVPLVLDNTNFKIFPATERKDLIPIYNFNGDALYLAGQKGVGEAVENQKTHKKWDQLITDIKRNKL